MRRIIAVIFMLGAAVCLHAQQKSMYEQKYDLLVSKLGPAGVGIENVIENWEKEDSTNVRMLYAKFSYYFVKSQSSQVVKKTEKKYLGMDPLLSLKDSTGTDIYYYEDKVYDDELYGLAIKAAEKAVTLYPDRLDFRFMKINALMAYEKDSPDMALVGLKALIDENSGRSAAWTYEDHEVKDDFFEDALQEYCYSFWTIGSPSSYNAFMRLSEHALKYYPDNVSFMNNMGSYSLVVDDDYKTALKWYNKVLKRQPDDYNAIKNCITLARKQGNVKLEKKYLKMMVEHGPEKDRMIAESRLKSIGS